MLEKASAALKTTPTTIPQTSHISKNPQKKKKKATLKMIHFAFFAANVFSIRISRKQARGLKFVEKDREANDPKNIFKKMQKF